MTAYLVRLQKHPVGTGDTITADSSTEAAQRWASYVNPQGHVFERAEVVVTNPDGVADKFTIEVEMAPRFKILRRFR